MAVSFEDTGNKLEWAHTIPAVAKNSWELTKEHFLNLFCPQTLQMWKAWFRLQSTTLDWSKGIF